MHNAYQIRYLKRFPRADAIHIFVSDSRRCIRALQVKHSTVNTGMCVCVCVCVCLCVCVCVRMINAGEHTVWQILMHVNGLFYTQMILV